MKAVIFEIIEKYKIQKLYLLKKYEDFFNKKENSCFWEQWTSLHIQLFENLKLENNISENQNNLLEINKDFITKRARMASAFVQGLKSEKSISYPNTFKLFKEISKEHDEFFKNFLAEVLNYYSKELIKIQSFRKFSAAYVHAHLSQGG